VTLAGHGDDLPSLWQTDASMDAFDFGSLGGVVLSLVVIIVLIKQIVVGHQRQKFLGRGGIQFCISREKEPFTYWSQMGFLSIILSIGVFFLFYFSNNWVNVRIFQGSHVL
jgi:hypothetical protein